jgi:hypothetical protein
MTPKKSLQEREYELRSLLATPAGREELQALASRYAVTDHFKTSHREAPQNQPLFICS